MRHTEGLSKRKGQGTEAGKRDRPGRESGRGRVSVWVGAERLDQGKHNET